MKRSERPQALPETLSLEQLEQHMPPPEPTGRARPNIWTTYRVWWFFLTRLCGSVPGRPELIEAWLKARQPAVRPPGAPSIDETNAEVLASLARGEGEAPTEFSELVFQRDRGHLCERYGTIRAHMKEAARTLSAQYIGRIEGARAFSTRVINGVYLDPRQYWIPIRRRDGTPVTAPDGAYDKPVHATAPGGRTISALKRIHYIEPGAMLEFTIHILGDSVHEKDLDYLFTFGGTHGYAGERGDGEGRYEYEFQRIATAEHGRPQPAAGKDKAA